MFRSAVAAFFREQRQRIGSLGELVASRSPQQILRMGFAVVRAEGRAVASVRQVTKGQSLTVEVADGEFSAEAK